MKITNEAELKQILPQDLQEALEKARNDVTLMQAETRRLLNLRNSLEKDVFTKSDEVNKIEERISILEKEKTAAEVRAEKANDEAQKAEKNLSLLTNTCKYLVEESKELKERLEKVDAILKS